MMKFVITCKPLDLIFVLSTEIIDYNIHLNLVLFNIYATHKRRAEIIHMYCNNSNFVYSR